MQFLVYYSGVPIEMNQAQGFPSERKRSPQVEMSSHWHRISLVAFHEFVSLEVNFWLSVGGWLWQPKGI